LQEKNKKGALGSYFMIILAKLCPVSPVSLASMIGVVKIISENKTNKNATEKIDFNDLLECLKIMIKYILAQNNRYSKRNYSKTRIRERLSRL
jgi:hypothetical protein